MSYLLLFQKSLLNLKKVFETGKKAIIETTNKQQANMHRCEESKNAK